MARAFRPGGLGATTAPGSRRRTLRGPGGRGFFDIPDLPDDLLENPPEAGEQLPEDLEGNLERFFLPEFERRQGALPGQEQQFMEDLQGPTDFGRTREEMTEVAQGITEELFRTGGQVDQATQDALRTTIQTGFGPSSGGFDRARQNILDQAVGRVTSGVAQAAPQLAQTTVQDRLGRLSTRGREIAGRREALENIRQSLFGGQANIEQLELARQQLEQNRELAAAALDEGGDAGSVIGGLLQGGLGGFAVGGPIGAGIGGVLGGLGGLF